MELSTNKGIAPEKKRHIFRRIYKCRQLYLLILPAIVAVFVFHYIPIVGVQIAFKDYRTSLGVWNSEWVGFKHFIRFLTYPDFWKIMKNTLSIGLYSYLTFPCSVILALSINEIKSVRYKKAVQMITYAPHFISTVVLVSMINLFFSRSNGLVNNIIELFGGTRIAFLEQPKYFYSIYVWSGVWTDVGWGTIVYLAALAGVSQELVEAAHIDGANRFQVIKHINIPCILPTIITMLILRTGSVVSVGFEKIFLMQNSFNLDVSRVISTYVYEMGIMGAQYSFSAAIGLFNNLINVFFIIVVNQICKKLTSVGLF